MNPVERLATCFAVVAIAVAPLSAAPSTAQTPVMFKGQEVHPTHILARAAPSKGDAVAHAAALEVMGLEVTQTFDLVPGLVVLEPTPAAQAASVASPKDAATKLQEQIDSLRATGLYAYVEPDYIVHAYAAPNDTSFTDGTLWGLSNTGQSGGTAGMDVDALRAWDITTGSPSVIVAVIDTGIRYTHVELSQRMWTNPGEVAGNGIDDDNNGYVDDVHGINAITRTGDPMDDNDHGTHCAGTIGAAANDGHPHVGVAWNVRLMGCKFLSATGSGANSDSIRCIDYAVSKGAKILSNSWGGGGFQQALLDSIAGARNAGVLFVAAAGNGDANGNGLNNDTTPNYPSNYDVDNIIAVAAIDRTGALARFSNYGATMVDVGAPGVAIYSSTADSDTSYASFNGTSMATPHVSGVAALVMSRFPDLSMSDLRSRIIQSAVATTSLTGKTVSGGRASAYAALNASADGVLEVSLSPVHGASLVGGSQTPIYVRVTDLFGVTNATVTGTASGVGNLTFVNNGVAPDAAANDAIYTAMLNVPTSGTSLTVNVSASAPGKTGSGAQASYLLRQPPANDLFASRAALSGTSASTTGTNVGATKESGEPSHAGNAGGKSVWWTWTAPSSGVATINTTGSSFDTTLGVYTGTAVSALATIVANDDSGGTVASAVTFNAVSGTAYQIAVDGFNGASGSITLHLEIGAAQPPPANDNFANAIATSASLYMGTGSNVSATKEAGEPNHAGNAGGKSVWWTWTAPVSGAATIRTSGSAINTILGVYTGSTVSSLTGVASDNDSGGSGTSLVTFQATAGTAYRVAVDGYNGVVGGIILSIEVAATPGNDAFASRIALNGTAATATGTNAAATLETGEPLHASNPGGKSVWWTWTAPSSGTVTVHTGGSSFDTLLAVYTGSAVNALTSVASNDNDPNGGNTSRVTFNAVAGTVYQIAVDGRNDGLTVASGSIALSLTLGTLVVAPPNDHFANRIALSGNPASATGTNSGATRETGEPNHAGYVPSRTVWWTWTAPSAGALTINTIGSNFDTVLAVYTGTAVNALTGVAANDDSSGLQSSVTFNVTAGTAYQIAVDGFSGLQGNIALSITLAATGGVPANDNFANRTAITGYLATIQASNVSSTLEIGEPNHGGRTSSHSVWWTWTAPAVNTATITTAGSNYDTTLNVYTGTSVSALASVAGNDDVGSGNLTSRVQFTTVAGTVYQIAIDGYDGATGSIVLNLSLAGGTAPSVNITTAVQTVGAGGAATLTANTTGSGPFTYQWLLNGAEVAGATGSTLALPCMQSFHAGNYTVRVTNDFGSSTSAAVPMTVNAVASSSSRILNLSTRALCRTGDDVLIPGFVIDGSGTKQLLIRAVGPTLGVDPFNLSGVLPNPQLTLKRMVNGSYQDFALNNDWGTNANVAAIRQAAARVWAFALTEGSTDAALLVDLPVGQYTVTAADTGSNTGIAIVEFYDADEGAGTAKLVNLSNRGYVGVGDQIMIPGVIISDEGPKTLLVRAVGPGLTQFGVGGLLANPQVAIYRGGDRLLTNDNWGSGADAVQTAATAAQVFAFPLQSGSADAAFVVTLPAGAYTVQASGVGETTGVVLVEVYVVP